MADPSWHISKFLPNGLQFHTIQLTSQVTFQRTLEGSRDEK